MVNIGVWYYGVRHFTTKPKALNTAADAKGLKIRVPEAPLFLDMIRALNAAPTPMTLSEVYLALQTGVVDGQENPLPTINNNKFYEVQKYLNLTSHIIVPQLVMVNAKYWATLSDADKAAVIEAFAEGGKVNDGLTREAEGQAAGRVQGQGHGDRAARPRLVPAGDDVRVSQVRERLGQGHVRDDAEAVTA